MAIERPPSRQPLPAHAERVFRGQMFDVYQWPQQLYDGRTVIFEKLKRPDTVVVYPVLPDGRILLTRQEQPGKPPFIGAAGGRVDEGEDIEAAAQRELLEETGYRATSLTLYSAQQPISKIEWAVYTFVARGLAHVAPQALDGGEKIELMPVTFDELIALARDPRFAEVELVPDLIEARYDAAARARLQQLFSP